MTWVIIGAVVLYCWIGARIIHSRWRDERKKRLLSKIWWIGPLILVSYGLLWEVYIPPPSVVRHSFALLWLGWSLYGGHVLVAPLLFLLERCGLRKRGIEEHERYFPLWESLRRREG